MKLFERFLITMDEREIDPSEVLFFKGIEGLLSEFEEYLKAMGHIQEPFPKLNLIKSTKEVTNG